MRETRLIDKLASEIYEIVASAECSDDAGCDYIAFGSKPCGGPWGYLVYSTSVDVQLLKQSATVRLKQDGRVVNVLRENLSENSDILTSSGCGTEGECSTEGCS